MFVTRDNESITIECFDKCSILQILPVDKGEYTFQYYCSYKHKNFKAIEQFNQDAKLCKYDFENLERQFYVDDYSNNKPSCITFKSFSGGYDKNCYLIRVEPTVEDSNFPKKNNIYNILVYKIKLPKNFKFTFAGDYHYQFTREEELRLKSKLLFGIVLGYKEVGKLYNILSKVKASA